jgi:hypothetical protein
MPTSPMVPLCICLRALTMVSSVTLGPFRELMCVDFKVQALATWLISKQSTTTMLQ